MAGLAKFLETQSFRVANIDYPSTRYPIEALADIVHRPIEDFARTMDGKLHFVGHSMGGLLIRAYLHKFRPDNLGRTIMLGTPNNGSEVADFIKNMLPYKWFYGPAGQQLVTDQSAFVHHFGKIDYELGIIAGNKSIAPLSSFIIRKPNDGKVSVDSTRLKGAKGHVILPYNHTFLPLRRQVWEHIAGFIGNGSFT